MIKVVVADDHQLIRDGISKLITEQDDLILEGETGTAEETMNLLRRRPVDVVILDISLPDKDGIEVLKDIKAEKIPAKVLMLSMHPENRYARRALKNGAAGYLTKGYDTKTVADAIRKVYKSGSYITDKVAEEVSFASFGESFEEERPPHERLSDREYQVFLLIGKGEPVGTIASRIGISVSSVHTYRKRIFEKTGFSKNAELVSYLYAHNLL